MIDRIKSWRPRFSVRTLLLAMALMAAIAAWFTATTLRQRRAVAELTKLGADVLYEDTSNSQWKSWYPQWLRNWLGIDFFANATEVAFGDSDFFANRKLSTQSTVLHSAGNITSERQISRKLPWPVIGEDAMEQVRRLPYLRKLTISAFTAKQASSPNEYPIYDKLRANAQLDVPALQLLKDHPTLEELELPCTYVDDEVLAGLHGFHHIKRLKLGPPVFSESGGKHLESLPNLEELSFEPLIKIWLDSKANPFQPWPMHERLPRLSNLRVLCIPDKTVSNETARCFEQRLPRLENIIGRIEIDDEGIRFIGSLWQLRELNLDESGITDTGAAYLAKLSELRFLSIWSNVKRNKITDEGLRHLSKLTNLETLRLNGLPITDAGLKHLRGLTGMKCLVLYGTKITDAGLVHLSGMTGLKFLNLSSTTVTDESIDQLLKFKNLKNLEMYRTGISQRGAERLKAALPNCEFRGLPTTAQAP